jgi:hypothetical protein
MRHLCLFPFRINFFFFSYLSYLAFWPVPMRINLVLWILWTLGRTPWTANMYQTIRRDTALRTWDPTNRNARWARVKKARSRGASPTAGRMNRRIELFLFITAGVWLSGVNTSFGVHDTLCGFIATCSLLGVGWDESTWYVGHYLIFCTSPGW